MAIRNIRTENDPILRKKSRVVENFDEKLWQLLDDMKETMEKAEGVGLAAVQVGILKRVVVINVGDGLMELINPEILETEGVQCSAEGCLSLPGKQGTTIRPMTVKVKAQNRNGNWCVYKGTELKAKAFCHEIDHLDGVLYIDKLASKDEIEKYCKD
ncbi:MAG: peptide deformylase [Clostridia bacterium]|nr:peptide deformylase [Clostridia bacterium]